jgi:putative glutamine amidotransferase
MPKPRIAIPVPTSFDAEYNQRSWPQYAAAIERSGGEPVEVPLTDSPAVTAKLIASCSGILLPGSGADVDTSKYGQQKAPESADPDPLREHMDELLLADARDTAKPLFTICFGTQMLNVWRGGSLIQHIPPGMVDHRQRGVIIAHEAAIAPHSLLAELVAAENPPERDGALRLPVNSSHHQAIDAPGDGLRIAARSSEDGVVEAIENSADAPGGYMLGVQWHPERTYNDSAASRALFARFIHEASTWTSKPATTTD